MRNYSLKTKGNFPHNSKYTRFKRPILGALILFVVLVGAEPILKWCGGFLLSPLYSVRQYIETSSATIPSYIRERALLHDRIQSLEKEIETQKEQLLHLFSIQPTDNTDKISSVKELFNITKASEATQEAIKNYTFKAFDTLQKMNIETDKKDILRSFGKNLMSRNV